MDRSRRSEGVELRFGEISGLTLKFRFVISDWVFNDCKFKIIEDNELATDCKIIRFCYIFVEINQP